MDSSDCNLSAICGVQGLCDNNNAIGAGCVGLGMSRIQVVGSILDGYNIQHGQIQ